MNRNIHRFAEQKRHGLRSDLPRSSGTIAQGFASPASNGCFGLLEDLE
jgi:hypothetical protein